MRTGPASDDSRRVCPGAGSAADATEADDDDDAAASAADDDDDDDEDDKDDDVPAVDAAGLEGLKGASR